ncbi:MAG: alpha/beta fold hydrolase [Candidatus Limnocylindrales bacterium]
MSARHRIQGATLIEREHVVPLVHDAPDGRTLSVFTREVVGDGAEQKPYLVFLQGGPGFEATRATSPLSGWQKRAAQDYRVLLLDQRGTGRSTPVGKTPSGDTPDEQAAYLAHFRADSIVRDAELIRRELGIERWSVLGQSFGGFCAMTYLSIAPDGLREAFITGGLSPVGHGPDEIYRATWARTLQKNAHYFDRYPDDRARVREILSRLTHEEVRLPTGDRLTPRRFRQVGAWLGDSAGWELIHHVIELPIHSAAFAHDIAAGSMKFERNPIYFSIHEASYADGAATRWSASRTMPAQIEDEGLLTAEHVFPWMPDDYAGLRDHGDAANILAEREWPRLYDEAVLQANQVPTAATIYVNDLYVERRFAEETAATIRGLKPWITNEYEHNGLRADGEKVLGRLFEMVR